jgi:hypothetical protein
MRARPENAKEDRVGKQRLLVCTLGTTGIPVVPFCCDTFAAQKSLRREFVAQVSNLLYRRLPVG